MAAFNLFTLAIHTLVALAGGKDTTVTPEYGFSSWQNQMLHMECLHSRGFTGKGIVIADFDDGFNGIDTVGAYSHIFKSKRIKASWDFVFNRPLKYEATGSHGAHTFSVLAAHNPGLLVGTAYDASFLLAHTEDSHSETHREEEYWKQAVEWADSLGADIITSSLGYALFDSLQGDYTQRQLDGKTAIITKAADYAASKGMLVVVPAGNSGRQAWGKISFPGDADSALTVGAVDSLGKYVSFSGRGPTADGRVKPDVAAMGHLVYFLETDGRVSYGSGTSFSTPIIAGMTACLMQAHGKRNNTEIITAIRQSSDDYLYPNAFTGYGIPNACLADSLLARMDELADGTVQQKGHNALGFDWTFDPSSKTLTLLRAEGVPKPRISRIWVRDKREKNYFYKEKPRFKKGTVEVVLNNIPTGYLTFTLENKKGKRTFIGIWN